MRRQGEPPDEAVRRAGIQVGRIPQAIEALRDQRGVPWIEDFARDLRHGVRTLRRQPGFLAAVVLTLGVGVGGSAAIFGAVNGILLEPLPYPDADRIVAVWQHDRRSGNDRQEVSPANFLDWRERSRAFERLAAIEPFGLDWSRPEGCLTNASLTIVTGFDAVSSDRSVLLTAFAALALALAAAGIFGLMSFVTTRRTREFGVRLALGAPRTALFRRVLTHAFALTAIGMILGLAGAVSLTRLLMAMLFEVTPLDPATFTAAIVVLGTAAALASLYPAARAARVNPSTILQSE